MDIYHAGTDINITRLLVSDTRHGLSVGLDKDHSDR